ncbi:MAG TPA: low molecular weight protein-tyrosine-phosphatase [Propionibacteriaceae bacterium]
MRVVFVCWGNICRSPVAERVAQKAAEDEGLTEVEFTSAATSSEELGAPMDPRAAAVLRRSGYSHQGHVAHQIDAAELQAADLVVAMEDIHVLRLRRLNSDAQNISLLSDFDPAAEPGSGLPDPWYGPDSAFDDTLAAVEAAMPGVLRRVRELQRGR